MAYMPGCYADATFGHEHTRKRCAEVVGEVLAHVPSRDWSSSAAASAMFIASLSGPMPDDAWDEHEAADFLNKHDSHAGFWWGWQDGDFGLWPEDDRETLA